MLAKSAERHGDKRQKGEIDAHVGKHEIKGRQHGTGDAHAPQADRPAKREHPVRRNSHHGGRLAVLRRRLKREPGLGPADEEPQPDERRETDDAGRQLRPGR